MHPKHFKFCNSEGGGIWGNVESDPLVVPRAQGRSLGFLRYPRATPLAGRCRRGNTRILTERWQVPCGRNIYISPNILHLPPSDQLRVLWLTAEVAGAVSGLKHGRAAPPPPRTSPRHTDSLSHPLRDHGSHTLRSQGRPLRLHHTE